MKQLNKLIILLFVVGLFSQRANAQVKVGDNPTTLNGSAVLELESTNKGFLPPRLTTTQRNSIPNPATGLVIYNISIPCLQVNYGTPSIPVWQCVSSGSVVATLDCAGATHNGTLTNGTSAIGVSSVISYTGGNGSTHTGQVVSSTGVVGLTATLSPGSFATGSGTLTYTITGTPSTSGTAIFAISIGGQMCNLTRTVNAAQISTGGTAIVSSWTSTIGCSVGAGTNNSPAGVRRGGVNETMVQGVSVQSSASVTLVANVTTAGSYIVSTNTVNGVTFSASGVFGTTGAQTVTLIPSGTPALSGNYIWTLNTTPNITIYGSVLTTSAPLGNSYNAHFNGIISGAHVGTTWQNASQTTGETFNNNTTCQNKPVSAQGCGGVTSVTASSGRVHSTININGQCWLQTNLIDVPSVYNTYTTGSWTNTTPDDQGYWGYYNTSNTSGSAGWSSTEPAANEGRLYQWCGAMNANISERSRGICPAGFHIPSDCEWMYLEHGQGMSITNQNSISWRANSSDNEGTPGYKLKSVSVGSGATNVSGFSVLMHGNRLNTGGFLQRTTDADIISSSLSGSNVIYRSFNVPSNIRGVKRETGLLPQAFAFGVRCLKD